MVYGQYMFPYDGSDEKPNKFTEESLGFEKPREDTKIPAEEPLDANTEAQVPFRALKNGPGPVLNLRKMTSKFYRKPLQIANQVL